MSGYEQWQLNDLRKRIERLEVEVAGGDRNKWMARYDEMRRERNEWRAKHAALRADVVDYGDSFDAWSDVRADVGDILARDAAREPKEQS